MARSPRTTEPKNPNPNGWRETYRQESVRCGKKTCACRNGGPLHGPYWYAFWTEPGGGTRKRYVGKSLEARLVAQQPERWAHRDRPASDAPPARARVEAEARAIVVVPSSAILSPAPPPSAKSPSKVSVHMLLIRLLDTKPVVFRRILVPSATLLSQLDAILQIVMGRASEHQFRFDIEGEVYGPNVRGVRDAATPLSAVMRKEAEVSYASLSEHDKRDLWYHAIKVQDVADVAADRSLRCFDGKWLAPKEGSGGPKGQTRRQQTDRFDHGPINAALAEYAARAIPSTPPVRASGRKGRVARVPVAPSPPVSRRLVLEECRATAFGVEFEFADEEREMVLGMEFRLPLRGLSPYLSVTIVDYGKHLGERAEGYAKAPGTGRKASFGDAYEAAVREWRASHGVDGIDWDAIEQQLDDALAFDTDELKRLHKEEW